MCLSLVHSDSGFREGSLFFFLNDAPPPEIYTLPLHDALPISLELDVQPDLHPAIEQRGRIAVLPLDHRADAVQPTHLDRLEDPLVVGGPVAVVRLLALLQRSEEHTSELQSQSNIVCRLLLLEK